MRKRKDEPSLEQPEEQPEEPLYLAVENCYDIVQEGNSWKETGLTVSKRWIMPQAIVDLEEEQHDGCVHYVVTIEFSNRHFDWSAQRLRFGSDKEIALAETKKLVEKLSNWPLMNARHEKR